MQIDKNIKLTIHIVDDSDDEHFFIKEALREYENVSFNDYFNGADFLSYVEKKARQLHELKSFPEIVILDVNMPKMNGFEVYEAIEREGLKGHMEFYIMTSSITPNEKTNCEKYKLRCYKKPFEIAHFTKLLEEIIAQSTK